MAKYDSKREPMKGVDRDDFPIAVEMFRQQHSRWAQWCLFFFGSLLSEFTIAHYLQGYLAPWIAPLVASGLSVLWVCAAMSLRRTTDAWKRTVQELEFSRNAPPPRFLFGLFRRYSEQFDSREDFLSVVRIWDRRLWSSIPRLLTFLGIVSAILFAAMTIVIVTATAGLDVGPTPASTPILQEAGAGSRGWFDYGVLGFSVVTLIVACYQTILTRVAVRVSSVSLRRDRQARHIESLPSAGLIIHIQVVIEGWRDELLKTAAMLKAAAKEQDVELLKELAKTAPRSPRGLVDRNLFNDCVNAEWLQALLLCGAQHYFNAAGAVASVWSEGRGPMFTLAHDLRDRLAESLFYINELLSYVRDSIPAAYLHCPASIQDSEFLEPRGSST